MAFQPGQSGNPSGRPKEDQRLKEMARAKTAEAFAVVVAAMSDPDKRIALAAAQTVLDRGYGKPAQAIVGDADQPVAMAITWGSKAWEQPKE